MEKLRNMDARRRWVIIAVAALLLILLICGAVMLTRAPRADAADSAQGAASQPPQGVFLVIGSDGDMELCLRPGEPSDVELYEMYIRVKDAPTWRAIEAPAPAESVVATGLAHGVEYELKLRCKAGEYSDFTEVFSGVAVNTTPPAPPTGLNLKEDAGIVTLTWEVGGEPDLEGYRVFYERVGDGKSYTSDTPAASPLFEKSGFKKGFVYEFYVCAMDSAGNMSDPSDLLSLDLDNGTVTTQPAAASTTGGGGQGQRPATTTRPAQGGAASATAAATTKGAATERTTADAATKSETSGRTSATAETTAASSATTAATTRPAEAKPGVPTGVSAKSDGNSGLIVSWNPDAGAELCEISYKKTANTKFIAQTARAAAGTASIPGLAEGEPYHVRLRFASSAGVWGDYSAIITATPRAADKPAPPGSFAASPKNRGVLLTWVTADHASRKGYLIEYRLSGTSAWTSVSATKNAVSRSVPELVNGQEYEFRICTQTQTGVSDWSAIIRCTPRGVDPPKPPSGVRAVARDDSSVTVSWNAQSNVEVTGYEVFWLSESQAPIGRNEVGKTTSYVVTGLNAGSTYYFYVVTLAGDISSDPSHTVAATTKARQAAAVTDFSASALADGGSVRLSWSFSGTAESFLIECRKESGGSLPSETASGSARSYTYTGLEENVLYQFYITVITQGGEAGARKGPLVARTENTRALEAPTGLSASASAEGISVSFSSTGAAGYEVGYRAGGGSYSTISLGAGVTRALISMSALEPGRTYEIVVRGVDSSGNLSPWSSSVSCDTPAASLPPGSPFDVRASVDGGTAQVTWTGGMGADVTGYQVRYSGGGYDEIVSVGAGVESCVITLPDPDVSYSFSVRAVGPGGESAWVYAG